MTAQDRQLLFCAFLSGTALLLTLSGLSWGVVNLINLIPSKETA